MTAAQPFDGIRNLLKTLPKPDAGAIAAVRAREGELTKPAGALGRLETLAIELAGLQHTEQPQAMRVPILIFAGDHGIAAQGVSAFPQEVTIAMLANFAVFGLLASITATTAEFSQVM